MFVVKSVSAKYRGDIAPLSCRPEVRHLKRRAATLLWEVALQRRTTVIAEDRVLSNVHTIPPVSLACVVSVCHAAGKRGRDQRANRDARLAYGNDRNLGRSGRLQCAPRSIFRSGSGISFSVRALVSARAREISVLARARRRFDESFSQGSVLCGTAFRRARIALDTSSAAGGQSWATDSSSIGHVLSPAAHSFAVGPSCLESRSGPPVAG